MPLPGRDGRRGGLATFRRKKPENWLAAVDRNRHGIESEEPLDPETRAVEALLMGLRLAEGVDPARIEARAGLPFVQAVDREMLAALVEEGYLAWRAGRLCATGEGILRLDAILPVLLR